MALLGKKGRLALGVDIGSSSIKLVELKEEAGGYRLLRLASYPLPPGAVVERSIMDSTIVVEALRSLLSSQKVRNKRVAVAVAGHSVIVKKVVFPKMTPKELEENLLVEAERYIPFDIKDVNLDYHVVSKGEEEMEVLLVAAKRDLVEDYISLLREARLEPAVIDVDVFAIQSAFELNYPQEVGDLMALCDIGASIMSINVVKGGESLFTRDISIGGNLYTEELQKELGVSFEEAEGLKLGRGTEKVEPTKVERIVDRVSHMVSMEIAKSLDFFSATYPEDRIRKLYLTGGTSKVPRLKDIIEERTKIPVEVLNPFNNLVTDTREFSPEYLQEMAPLAAVGVGLALRKV